MTRQGSKARKEKPLLEWIAAGAGLLLTLAILGFLLWQAVHDMNREPTPSITVDAGSVLKVESGYVVEVIARNGTHATAAGVEVEGTLERGGETVATGSLTFDYVPGKSQRQGGLFFKEDPRAHTLELNVLGYTRP